MKIDQIGEKWSKKYKKSIDCDNPKGFSQRAHCAGRKKANEELTDFDKEQPMKSTVAVPGYGTMNIDTLMKNVIDQTTNLLKQMQQGTQGFRNADYELNRNRVLPTKIAALIQALDDLQAIRSKGGARSRNIQQEDEEQQQRPPLPIDIRRINEVINRFEGTGNFTPEEADAMRRGIQGLSSRRQTVHPVEILQLLTALVS
jgi:hypothetical protein